ncbi:MAG: hypothetical protein JST75_19085 [Bacteroidetes bacterium]|nr:hypothetical protein [Bacteroidota bacterium]
MKKIILLFTLSVILFNVVSAQNDSGKKGFDKSKLFIGGNFGLGFSSYSTAINISPQLGYRFSQLFAAGVGVNYAYYNYKYYYYASNNISQRNIYSYAGLNIFGRIYPIPQFFIHAQPEVNYIWGKQKYYNPDAQYNISGQFVPSFLVGGGAAIPAGRGALTISVLYDVLQNNLSPYYRQAVYGLGFNVGF